MKWKVKVVLAIETTIHDIDAETDDKAISLVRGIDSDDKRLLEEIPGGDYLVTKVELIEVDADEPPWCG